MEFSPQINMTKRSIPIPNPPVGGIPCSIEIKKSFSMPLDEMVINSNQNLLRVIHYPPIEQNPPGNAVRAAAHEDINLITILCSGNEPGLQALDLNNKCLKIIY